jgi:response regulator of citrate/malate metabolism
MEQLSTAKQTILATLDEEIEKLEKKLRKVQPYLDELASLKRTRATLLSERLPTGGGVRRNSQLTMETMIHALREADGPMETGELAEKLGVDQTIIRSHLNRFKDQRYRRTVDGWELIGEGK